MTSQPVRAAVLHRHGGVPVVEERAHPRAPGPEGCLVRVSAVPITPLDVLCASGASYFGPPPLPYVPGVQGVGEIVHHPTLPTGTPVWFPTEAGMRPGDGSLSTYTARPAGEVVDLSGLDVPATEVAALGLSAVAAWMALTWRANLQPGEQVLVLGAGGVVGQVAVQAARLIGARRVVAAARSAAARERAFASGADAVAGLEVDDTVETLFTRLDEMTDGPVDVVIDPLGGVPATAGARLLANGGRLVNLGDSAGPSFEVVSTLLRSHSASVLGYTNNSLSPAQRSDALRVLLGHAAKGLLRVAHEVVSLDAVGDAWSLHAEGRNSVRFVVDLS